jgi:abhydrolase domain-containing protein 6
MPTQSNSSRWETCRHPRCHHLLPRPTLLHRKMAPFSLGSLDLMLRMIRSPDALIEFGRRFSRRLNGVQLRAQRVGERIWPYLEGGRGDSIVLLHGFGTDKDRFGALLLMMGRGFHYVVPDVPGFGEHRQGGAASYDIDTQVLRLERFVDAVGLEQFHLMGISLGGFMAAYYAARNPDRVSSLCLMDSAGFSSPVRADAMRRLQDDGYNIFLPMDGGGMQLLIDHLLHHPVRLPDTLKRYWLKQSLDLLPWRRKLLEDLLDGGLYILDSVASRIQAPTLVIWGAQDRIFHVTTVDTIMALIEDCHAYIIHGCGHIPIVEFPILSARIYKDFLRTFSMGARLS